MSYLETLAAQHRACDADFVTIEQAAHRGDWRGAALATASFVDAMETHFRYEEDQLFPALEAATPAAVGPTSVMRSEHAQMRELLAALTDATAAQNADLLTEAADTLLLLMQQHNAKEESVLYPIADRTLPALLQPETR